MIFFLICIIGMTARVVIETKCNEMVFLVVMPVGLLNFCSSTILADRNAAVGSVALIIYERHSSKVVRDGDC